MLVRVPAMKQEWRNNGEVATSSGDAIGKQEWRRNGGEVATSSGDAARGVGAAARLPGQPLPLPRFGAQAGPAVHPNPPQLQGMAQAGLPGLQSLALPYARQALHAGGDARSASQATMPHSGTLHGFCFPALCCVTSRAICVCGSPWILSQMQSFSPLSVGGPVELHLNP